MCFSPTRFKAKTWINLLCYFCIMDFPPLFSCLKLLTGDADQIPTISLPFFSTWLSVFFSAPVALHTSPPPPPPPPPSSFPTHTLCLKHLPSARQVFVARRQAVSSGLFFRERKRDVCPSWSHRFAVPFTHRPFSLELHFSSEKKATTLE